MKRIGTLFLVLILMVQSMGAFVSAANDNAGSPKHIPRIVSVVFDDSGSMENDHNKGQGSGFDKDLDRWAYASYAMQSFIAMMSEEDALYVTKLDENPTSVQIRLENKKFEIEEFKNLSRGDGGDEGDFTAQTWNVVPTAAEALVDAYETYGDNAKYYLVVMADGNLDPVRDEFGNDKYQQSYNEELPKVINDIGGVFKNTDFETIFFNMGGVSITAPGVTKISSANSSQIVDGLKEVSATVMGRNELGESNVSVSGGKVSFDISYPALSITIFAQKSNTSFENVSLTLTKDGKKVPCTVDTNTVKCADDLREMPASEKQVPAGFVSLITNGNTPLAKGKYMVDLSSYGISESKDVVILVEPAVKIGCKYFIGDSTEPKEFDEIKNSLRAGQILKIQCGLYEMNDDGSLGEEVDDKILSPEFELRVNDELVTDKVAGQKHTYQITMTEDKVGKDLEIKASVEPYQPFVHRETFSGFAAVPDIKKGAEDILLTKPMFKSWKEGKGEIVFNLSESADALVDVLEVRVEGIAECPDGIAGTLSNVKTEKNRLIYTPVISDVYSFGSLNESFTVSLYDSYYGKLVDDVTVKKVPPSYKFEIKNGLADENVTIGMLADNDKQIVFTLLADYDASGKYVSVDKADCEELIEFSLDTGILSGEIQTEGGSVSYVPRYELSENDASAYEMLGKDVSVYAVALVGDEKVTSDKVKFSLGSASYKVEVASEISEAFTLETIKTNSQKIVFTLLADYENDGTYGDLAPTDMAAKDIKIDTGKFKLPGKTGIEYGPDGNPVGVYFVPEYDETSSDKPFTEVAGKNHVITATYKDSSASTEVNVNSPVFDVAVRKELINVLDYNLCLNTEGVEFTVARDGRILSASELEGLAPYDISLSKNQKELVISPVVRQAEDGNAYLEVIPTHKNKSIFTRWLSFFVSHGETTVTLTAGNDADSATVKIGIDMPSFIWFVVVVGIIILILYLFACYSTLIMFPKGEFYSVSFYLNREDSQYYFSSYSTTKANPGKLKAFLRSSFPRRGQKHDNTDELNQGIREKSKLFPFPSLFMTIRSNDIDVGLKSAKFITVKGYSSKSKTRMYPYYVVENNNSEGFFEMSVSSIIDSIIGWNTNMSVSGPGSSISQDEKLVALDGENAIGYLDEDGNSLYIVFFLSKKAYNNILKNNSNQ